VKRRTRIKICGLTRREDVELALDLGADALGFVLWPGSPRYVSVARLKTLTEQLPAFAKTVGLFVNAARADINALLGEVPLDLLQFHGDESSEACGGYGKGYLRAARMSAELDLVEFEKSFNGARALLLDTHTPSYGGSGKVFDWSLIPAALAPRVVLSGGLNAQNVAEAIARVRPYAVDVSSGVEAAPGIKDPERMRQFFSEVARADQSI
jgi:phosphoribosylanthranilate isomerase